MWDCTGETTPDWQLTLHVSWYLSVGASYGEMESCWYKFFPLSFSLFICLSITRCGFVCISRMSCMWDAFFWLFYGSFFNRSLGLTSVSDEVMRWEGGNSKSINDSRKEVCMFMVSEMLGNPSTDTDNRHQHLLRRHGPCILSCNVLWAGSQKHSRIPSPRAT